MNRYHYQRRWVRAVAFMFLLIYTLVLIALPLAFLFQYGHYATG